ncbi:MAG: glutamate synthase-related protein [Candidatus Ranarchaeia archaeon]
MPQNYMNRRSTTGTRTRVKDVNPASGLCGICIQNCPVLCEVSKSSFRGAEVLYPVPELFGYSTSSSNKDYGLDWSHFNLLVSLIGAEGIDADSDKAIFPNVDVSTNTGGIPLKIPVFTAGLGSTAVAKNNWEGLAIGAAISGTSQVIGENVVGMDNSSKCTKGKVIDSPALRNRVDIFRTFWDGKHGEIIVQTNVEDERLGVDEYALSKLEVNVIERKWGQGAKAIGGEVRLTSIERAKELKKRGYVVIPDPEEPEVIEAFNNGVFTSFERHSRVGMPNKKTIPESVDKLKSMGAKKVFLKTGAYRPSAVAFTLKTASEAKIDHVTFDGAGGGTGMSPVPMMQECATPTVYLLSQVRECVIQMKKKGMYVPTLSIAGGFMDETQIAKAIAMSEVDGKPTVTAIAMARPALTAVMKAKYFTSLAKAGKLPKSFINDFGNDPETFFRLSPELKTEYGDRYLDIPKSAIGLYSYYYDRIGTGLKQLLAGMRKWKLDLLDRKDLIALSTRAVEATGIQTPEVQAKEEIKGMFV